jgi:prephenate dehydrogenase
VDALEGQNTCTKNRHAPVGMEAKAHDLHAAYVSHISHITSTFGNTVLEKERRQCHFQWRVQVFSTVRLASNPAMWCLFFRIK